MRGCSLFLSDRPVPFSSGVLAMAACNGLRAGRLDGMKIFEQRRADNETAKVLQDGRNVITLPGGDLPKQSFDVPRRKNDQHPEGSLRQIAPGMRNALVDGDACAGWRVQSLVPRWRCEGYLPER